jgi:hypothetical protein
VSPARTLVCGQLAFFAGLGGCVLIDTRGLWDNHGWSYYGTRRETAAVYAIGFLALVASIVVAASLLRRGPAPEPLAPLLGGLALALVLDLGTPDTIDQAFYDAHVAASVVLFLYELAVALWLVHALLPSRLGHGLVALQFAGGLVAMFSQLQWIGLLGLGILVFQGSFFLLLDVAVASVSAERELQPAPAV